MKRESYVCDICGELVISTDTYLYVPVQVRADKEKVEKTIDLCDKHIRAALDYLLNQSNYVTNSNLLEYLYVLKDMDTIIQGKKTYKGVGQSLHGLKY